VEETGLPRIIRREGYAGLLQYRRVGNGLAGNNRAASLNARGTAGDDAPGTTLQMVSVRTMGPCGGVKGLSRRAGGETPSFVTGTSL